MKKEHLILAVFAAAAIIHLLPHPDNITPVGALALLAGAYLRDRWMLALPLPLLFLGHSLAGYFAPLVMASIYGGFLCHAWIGRLCLRRQRTPQRLAAAWLGGALAFWFITNSAVWVAGHGDFYPQTLAGYLSCLAAGLPFLLRSLLGDLLYILPFFGLIELAGRASASSPALKRYLAA